MKIYAILLLIIFSTTDLLSNQTGSKTIAKSYAELKDIIIGNEKAPNTVIIYSSFSCVHCREFHQNEFPKFKEKYIDTGEVKVCLRNYINDYGSQESATLVRCLGNSINVVFNFYHEIYKIQKEWMKSKNPRQHIKNLFMKLGYNENRINKCLKNETIISSLKKEQEHAMNKLQISIIPAFVVNGKVHQGKLTCEELSAML